VNRRLLALPILAAGVATAVFVYTSGQTPPPPDAAPAVPATVATPRLIAQVDPAQLSILPGWLSDCLNPTSQQQPDPLDSSTWPRVLDPGNWLPPDCFDLKNLQVPDWLDPANITQSVKLVVCPGK